MLDPATGAELRRVPVLREPHHVALSPDGRDLLIGDAGGNEMLFLDPITAEIKRRLPMGRSLPPGLQPGWAMAGHHRASRAIRSMFMTRRV